MKGHGTAWGTPYSFSRTFIEQRLARLTYLLGVEVSLLHFNLNHACLSIPLLLPPLLLLLAPLLTNPLVAPAISIPSNNAQTRHALHIMTWRREEREKWLTS
jgi:hypothetical protein